MSVYLDHNASTPLHPEVLDEMMPFLASGAGNASSLHQSGRFRRSAIETARNRVAQLVNADPDSVIFTSGGTEANNLAIKGFVALGSETTVMASNIEHASILEPLEQLKSAGCRTGFLGVNTQGYLDSEQYQKCVLQHQPDLVSVQLANNETGVIQPLQQLAKFCHELAGSIVHSDGTQAAGKIEVDIQQLGVDMMTLSAHKLNGPQGAGALICRRKPVNLLSMSGGPQEAGRRAGTENVAMLAGFGKAAQIAAITLQEKQANLLELRQYFEQQISTIAGVKIFGQEAERLPNTSFFSIPYYHGETLLMQLDKAGFELASGSACHSQVTQPSHVLEAMGVDHDLALNAVRVSLGLHNTREQIDQLMQTLHNLINQLPAVMRQMAS
jgi:cysteine desulfurase